MGVFAKVTSKGQTTVPAAIRAELGVKPGDRLEYVRLPDGQIVVRKAGHPLASLRGLIKTDRPYRTDEIVGMVRDMRDGKGWLHDRD